MRKMALVFVILVLMAGCATTSKQQCLLTDPVEHVVPKTIRELCYANGIDLNDVSYCIIESSGLEMRIGANKTIVTSTGFISQVNDIFLKYALAHEIAHYKLNHVPKGIGVSVATSMVFTVAGVFIPGVGWLDYAVNPLVTTAFSRSFELDADAEAVRICQNAGFDDAPRKYIQALQWLKIKVGNGERDLCASHPPFDDRIAHIRETFGLN